MLRLTRVKSKLSLNFRLPERLKGGIIENSINYLRNVGNDYKNVYLETLQDIRKRPLKATIIGSILLSGGYCIVHNPTFDDFQMQLIDSNNCISRVPQSICNQKSRQYVHHLFCMNNKQILRYQSFEWRTFFTERIIDVGFLGRFHYLEHKMKDYDQ
ncbi:hypothetical protein BLA29_005466 [Euroglyphus maynei]|uniref:Uncharacterized protein n=1 Tax=Euroglyphus maynei TaxID=6958 RepID=A0A1Y3BEK2_EURMA|nr:hypothetical protein BLA29_005466 [Euroglyphus maynei]